MLAWILGRIGRKKFDFFVSYSTEDAHLVDGLLALWEVADRDVFVDRNSIKPGEQWELSLREALSASKKMVLVWCCHSSESEWVTTEIEQAIDEKISIVPILLCSLPVPKAVAKYQWLDLRKKLNHPCEHSADEDIAIGLVDAKNIMPTRGEPFVGGMWIEVPYTPKQYLLRFFKDHSIDDDRAFLMLDQNSEEQNTFAATVIRALELEWDGNKGI